MKLDTNWKFILRKAWSMRLGAIAVVFSVAEAVLPLYLESFPRGTFALLTAGVIVGAMVSRLVWQRGFD